MSSSPQTDTSQPAIPNASPRIRQRALLEHYWRALLEHYWRALLEHYWRALLEHYWHAVAAQHPVERSEGSILFEPHSANVRLRC